MLANLLALVTAAAVLPTVQPQPKPSSAPVTSAATSKATAQSMTAAASTAGRQSTTVTSSRAVTASLSSTVRSSTSRLPTANVTSGNAASTSAAGLGGSTASARPSTPVGPQSTRPGADRAAIDTATQQLTVVLSSVLGGLVAALAVIIAVVVLLRRRRRSTCYCRRQRSTGLQLAPQSNPGGKREPAAPSAVYGTGVAERDPLRPAAQSPEHAIIALDNMEYMQTGRLLSTLSDDVEDERCIVASVPPVIDRCVKPYACTSLLSQPAPKEATANGGRLRADEPTPYYSLPPLEETSPGGQTSHSASGETGDVPTHYQTPGSLSADAKHTYASLAGEPPAAQLPATESIYFVVDAVKR